MHPSIVNLSSRLHLCSGDVPPPLVGASATIVEPMPNVEGASTRLYLFGGRLVSNRRMVNHLYCLDLTRMEWSCIHPNPAPSAVSSSASVESTSNGPRPRYFHSADLWKDKIVIFGGMGYSDKPASSDPPQSKNPNEVKNDDLCVLDEVVAFDLTTQTWDLSFSAASLDDAADSSDLQTKPAPRYAHLSSISDDCLIIVGGQNMTNQYVESINVFSLTQRRWVSSQRFQRQCGSYRSLAVAPRYNTHEGERAKCYPRGRDPLLRTSTDGADDEDDAQGAPSVTRRPSGSSKANDADSAASTLTRVELNPLPTSSIPTAEDPQPVYVYSNYNFTDVRRELEVLRIQPEHLAATGRRPARRGSNASLESAIDVEMRVSPSQAARNSTSPADDLVAIEERSALMTGTTLPPGLRFPTGAILGSYLIISGTYLANATQTFSLWALHLPSMTWSRLEAGSHLSSGSWNRAILWASKNRMIVVGHKERDLVSDYNHRQTNWNHVVVLELEAWGIYQPPIPRLSTAAVNLGLNKLASSATSATVIPSGAKGLSLEALQQQPQESGDSGEAEKVAPPLLADSLGSRGDFEIVCSDGIRIGCDRSMLESRWPWLREKMDDYRRRARRTIRPSNGSQHQDSSLSLIPEELSDIFAVEGGEEATEAQGIAAAAREALEGDSARRRAHDPRFHPRHLQISEPSAIVLAFLQFLYTKQICTALQRHPAVVCALLVLSKTYQMDDLLTWARHAAHVALADDLNPKSASGASGNSNGLASSTSASSTTQEAGGLELFRPSDSLGLHPEERHRLAVCLYEAASLCGCEGLQIRALRVVMSVARWLQKHGASGGGAGSSGFSNERSSAPPDGGSSSRSSLIPGSGSGSGFPGPGSTQDSGNGYHHSQRSESCGSASAYHQHPAEPIASASGSSTVPDTSTFRDSPMMFTSPTVGEQDEARLRQPVAASPVYVTDSPRRMPAQSGLGLSHTEGSTSTPWPVLPDEAQSMSSLSPEEGAHRAQPIPGVGYDRYSVAEEDLLDAFGLKPPPERSTVMSRIKMSLSRSESQSRSPYPASSPSVDTDSSSAPSVSRTRAHSFMTNGTSPTEESFSAGHTDRSTASSMTSSSQQSLGMGSPPDLASRAHKMSLSTAPSDLPTPEETMASLATLYPHLSQKELKKMEKEERKRREKNEKARKKAQQAEYRRLAAEAVFGPKGGNGPVVASPSFDDDASVYSMSNGSTLLTDSGGPSLSFGSSKSSIRSGNSTASPGAASLKANKSPRSPATPDALWTVSTFDNGGWFTGGPSPFMQPSLKSAIYTRQSRSSGSVPSSRRS